MSSLNHGYWKSISELEADLPAGEEFTPADVEGDDDGVDPLSRRNFAKLMGASLALAGVAGAGCKRYSREEIVPLARRPEDQVPGTTQEYATAFELGGHVQPLVVTSYEGRPIKVDGNPEHPFAGGGIVAGTRRHAGTTAFAQGSILHLYDPDRSQSVAHSGKGASFSDWRAWMAELRKQASFNKVRVLSEATSSPTVAALRRRLTTAMPGLVWHEWEPLSWDNERAGMAAAFGKVVRPLAHLDRAETIVSLDCDFFVDHPAALRYSRDWARSRNAETGSLGRGRMNRLYVIESVYSSAGVLADHRLPVRSEHVLAVAQQLEHLLSGTAAPQSEVVKEAKVARVLEALSREVKANTGRVVFLAGRKQPAAVHALAARLNQTFGSSTVEYLDDPNPTRPTHAEAIATLAREIDQQQVETLFILGGNPVYDAPADLDFAGKLAKVATSVHLSEYNNETSAKATWHVPKAHYLETWGDAQTWDGTLTLQQPLIAPMYGGISIIELCAMLLGDETPTDAIVAKTFSESGAGGTWRQAVHDGFVDKTQLAPQAVQAGGGGGGLGGATGGSDVTNGQLEVTFVHSSATYDGRFANNAWLQETPDFLTKVVWDNVALLSPDTADKLGVSSQDVIRIKLGDRQLDIAALVMPGQAKGSIAVVLGGGRTKAGSVGNKQREWAGGGFDSYKLRASTGLDIAVGATVSKTGSRYKIATTQEHHDIRRGFSISKTVGDKEYAKKVPDLVREVEREELTDPAYKAEKDHPYYHDHHHGRGGSLFWEKQYHDRKWAMAIDLGNCMGCNACVVACQSENNVPVVGKREVTRNREMSWIRIDRYFKGDINDPEVVGQPVACQHCENAPCETVCPVGATLHSSEGLNDMVYNRCVGTRYCLNNCPYRVRRFNFFDYHKEFKDARNNVRKLLFNPDVTVRERGVMEKCTYCVQRIQGAKIKAKNAGERGFMPDGTITTACQAACPTEAIVFGDLSDPESRVSKMHGDRRQYELLGELNDKPRTRFLSRVRNPNPELVAHASQPAHH
ncbi:MAG TPA: 4Fe-4S dicluster domain-containing protein [Kofleriaceae bacterium]|nr:4Fe-4S dicluster domain-containing protein [Kofleriaceae bacterium]